MTAKLWWGVFSDKYFSPSIPPLCCLLFEFLIGCQRHSNSCLSSVLHHMFVPLNRKIKMFYLLSQFYWSPRNLKICEVEGNGGHYFPSSWSKIQLMFISFSILKTEGWQWDVAVFIPAHRHKNTNLCFMSQRVPYLIIQHVPWQRHFGHAQAVVKPEWGRI